MPKRSEFMENQSNKTIAVVGLGKIFLELSEGLKKKSLEIAYEFYSSIISGQIKRMGSLKEAEAVKVVIDGRNCLQKEKFIEAGIVYKGIGR